VAAAATAAIVAAAALVAVVAAIRADVVLSHAGNGFKSMQLSVSA
jgi:hypothetical protein